MKPELPKICCCGHAMAAHDVKPGEPMATTTMSCRDCTACPEYVGVGSYRAMQMLVLSDIFRTSKINVDVKMTE